jgi:hypothetical protein
MPAAMPVLEGMPYQLIGKVVHGEQDFRFHRPIKPGDQLVAKGAMTGWAARGNGTAACVYLETRTEAGELVNEQYVTFFVRGKRVVAYLTDDHHGDGRLALTCAAPPGVQEEVLDLDPERFFRPPYVGHRGWIGLRIDIDPDWEEVAVVIEEAFRCVAPVTLVRQLGARLDRSDQEL